MNRQQRRQQERLAKTIADKIAIFRKTNPLAEETYHAGYEAGWHAACDFCMKTCYAAAALTLRDLEKYGPKRNTRFLQRMDEYVTTALTSEEIIDEALEKAGVKICFREVFTEDRVQEVSS